MRDEPVDGDPLSDETFPPALRSETRQVAEAWGRLAAAAGERPIEPAQLGAGQVLLMPELAEPRLGWALLRAASGGWLLLPCDANSLVGSGDVAFHTPATGPLTLRGRFATPFKLEALAAARPWGTVAPEALARAESKLAALAAGRLPGSFSEEETDDDPEYQDWIEDVVRPAVARLQALVPVEGPAPPLAFEKRREPPTQSSVAVWRWAAVLAFLSLGAAGGFLWWRQGEELQILQATMAAQEAAHAQAIAKLEERRQELEATHQAELAAVGADRARLEAEHQRALSELAEELAAWRRAREVKNPLLAELKPGDSQVRGSNKLTVGPEVSHLVLWLRVDDPAGTEFRIEVFEVPAGKEIFAQGDLKVDVLGEVSAGVPAALLPPGDYRLRLLRREGAELRLVRDHELEIDSPPKRRPTRW